MSTVTTDKKGGGMASLAGKYLTFRLAAEEYGLEILKVQEIIKMQDITKIPRAPGFVRGVINLRGKVIPVVDLRLKFDMQTLETTVKTCIIVVQVKKATFTVTMGIIVDEVNEVLDVNGEQIEPAPEFSAVVEASFILGIGKVGKKVVILLDVNKVLASGEIDALTKETAA